MERKRQKAIICFWLFIVSYSSDYVQYVNSDGDVNYNRYNYDKAVRPFWNGRRNRVGKTPKLESHYQKNKQPFLPVIRQDKYKGLPYYDRR